MINKEIILNNLSKTFERRKIFSNINYSFSGNGIFGIAGSNGSGKSTLIKIIAGILSPTKGSAEIIFDNRKTESENLHSVIGFVAPYLILYDEFSAEENLILSAKIRGINYNAEKTGELFSKFLLYERRKDLLKTYSSGMKQRMKFIFSMIHNPPFLLFDEPTSNLDVEGKESVYSLIKETANNSLVLIASNEESDLALCSDVLRLAEYKK